MRPISKKTPALLLRSLSLLNVWLFDTVYGPAYLSKIRLDQQVRWMDQEMINNCFIVEFWHTSGQVFFFFLYKTKPRTTQAMLFS